MCGFVGIVTKDNKFLDEYQTTLKKRLNLISHRGPEGSQTKVGENYAVGHVILSIQGSRIIQNQPIENNRFLMLYNGEIFNQKFAKSINTYSQNNDPEDDSDTPTLFNGLIKEGINFLKNIDGFYSIFFYDKLEKKGWIVRDPSGQKPLYYEIKNKSLLFASEIKGISISSRAIDEEALETFKAIGYIPSPYTIFRDINSLRPGEVIEFSYPNGINGKIKIKHSRIFQISKRKNKDLNFEANFKNLISNKIKLNTVGSRDIAVLLSGGLDSSIILNEASKYSNIEAYTAKYDLPMHKQKKYNIDYFYAKRLCQIKNIPINTVVIDFNKKEKLIKAIDNALYFLDQPHFVGSILPKFEVANEINKRHPNIKIVLSGDAADEIFLGYNRYKLQKKLDLLFKFPLTRKIANLIWKLKFKLPKKYYKYFLNLKDKNYSHISTWMETDFMGKSEDFFINLINRINLLKKVYKENSKYIICKYKRKFYGIKDLWSWVADDSNMQNDRSFSHKGIESRAPFITSNLYEDLIPFFNYELVPKKSKEILHKAFSSEFEPHFFDRNKWGWTSPVHYWVDILGTEILEKALNSNFIEKYFSEINGFKGNLSWPEKWKIIICWRWSVINKI